MKLTVAIDDTYVRISDPSVNYSPDTLDDWTRRAGELLLRAVAIRTSCVDGEDDEAE